MNTVSPDFAAVAGTAFGDVVGALLTAALLTAVAVLVASAIAWAVAAAMGSWQTVVKARTGVFVALGGAALTGAALSWGGWLLKLGNHL
ncbi:DUF6112 family protein [Antribacter sp. KLBMP9083]|uniref:DUF6112 family protein n=1 Tax=Antribacter soli TaxID=2910976 RepID=A0AA41UE25_9MICO|nr:DUF6112 family protein [Antribacter soli]MCF4123659.1 DUF6112 family protein [Antribacter soli]